MPSIGRSLRRLPLLVLVLAAVQAPPGPAATVPAVPELLGLGHSGRIRFIIALPGDTVILPLRRDSNDAAQVSVRWIPAAEPAAATAETQLGADLRITVPAVPGVYLPQVSTNGQAHVFKSFHLLVQVPADESRQGVLRGYRIGQYPVGGSGSYAPPDGFIEVRPENGDIRVSRAFRLRDFLTHDQVDVWPKFALVDQRLIDKLELLIDELNRTGVRASGLTIMSGFRTPQYNAQGLDQGRASLSRHQYGDAADVWVDSDGDGSMDDLNGDGRLNREDAVWLLRAAERIEALYPDLAGGMSAYASTNAHGPFLHVDARGATARW